MDIEGILLVIEGRRRVAGAAGPRRLTPHIQPRTARSLNLPATLLRGFTLVRAVLAGNPALGETLLQETTVMLRLRWEVCAVHPVQIAHVVSHGTALVFAEVEADHAILAPHELPGPVQLFRVDRERRGVLQGTDTEHLHHRRKQGRK